MSILIKGMEMPKDPLYPVHATIYADGTVITGHGIGEFAKEAVPIPPHGRLIDADALYKDILEDVGYGEAERFNDYWLGEQPTIIEAEE